MRNVLPDWAVRLLVGTLLLPALLTALDGFFRVRRRRLAVGPWLRRGWAPPRLPVVLAWVWARGARRSPARSTPPDAPVLPLPPLERARLRSRSASIAGRRSRSAGSACAPLLLARARRARRARPPAAWPRPPARVLCTLAALVWVVNPYAAALLLPAAHLWLFAAAPQHAPARLGRRRRRARSGSLPFALAAALLRARARARPARAGRGWRCSSAASGQLSLAVAVVAAALLACLAGAARDHARAPARRRRAPSPSRCARAARSPTPARARSAARSPRCGDDRRRRRRPLAGPPRAARAVDRADRRRRDPARSTPG